MRKITYDIAISIDGFIAGSDQSVGSFLFEGEHVTDYYERLKAYDAVIMGRSTYEMGYQFGLKPGAKAYPHMQHYIYSKTIPVSSNDQVTVVREDFKNHMLSLKNQNGGTIYLCGGGQLAGFALENKLLDQVIIKVNPIILGRGIKLFETEFKSYSLLSKDHKIYKNGVVVSTYEIKY